MKKIKNFMMLGLVVCLIMPIAFILSACGDDSNPNTGLTGKYAMTSFVNSGSFGNGSVWTPGDMGGYYFDFNPEVQSTWSSESNYVKYCVPGVSFNGESNMAKTDTMSYTVSEGKITIINLTSGVDTASLSANVITLKCYWGNPATLAFTAEFTKQ